MISRGGYGEKEGPKYGSPISFIMINVRDAVYCTCTDPGPCCLEIWGSNHQQPRQNPYLGHK